MAINIKIFLFSLTFLAGFISAANNQEKDLNYIIEPATPTYLKSVDNLKHNDINKPKEDKYELIVDSIVFKANKSSIVKMNDELSLKNSNINTTNKYIYKLSNDNLVEFQDEINKVQGYKYTRLENLRVLIVNDKVKFSDGTLTVFFNTIINPNQFASLNELKLVRAFPSINAAIYHHQDFTSLNDKVFSLKSNDLVTEANFNFIDPDIIAE